MRSYTDEGIVIKRHNLGEADRLITLFSRSQGKLTLVARGVRRLTSKRAGSLELFSHIKFHAARGRGDLDTLTEVQPLNSFSSWRRHLGRVNLAYQLAETIDKLTPDRQPHPELLDLLKSHFLEIGNLKNDWKSKIEKWLIEIVRELGYWPKNMNFTGDIYNLIERTASRPLHSPKLLSKLK